ncbi:uncharacterized protein LAESUDRAFT_812070 [Laetiporus sulphureus 93-53]|uniref:DUF6534 domain-containing protein n=1 Tax=Laetiporus sulphureus 93-53 TaxID=1314785 RepID=A0A165EN13_9APHY|nr:uncharacterized protein LAESUDRAFT_812070 [Laetiporus sulphureus 93-53]KZT07403.1 hypothetical protein LAESUDRAFT_812070 [Laetiporus sulphureus 93-53]
MSEQPAPIMDLFRNSLGALLLGVFTQAIVYGVASSVTWTYFQRYAIDRGWFKAMIVTISISFVTTLVRCMFLNRLRLLYQAKGELNVWRAFCLCLIVRLEVSIPSILDSHDPLLQALLSLVDLAVATTITVKLFLKQPIETLNVLQSLFVTIFAVGISADVILASMMCICLHRSRTGLQRTDSMINLLIIYTINTGLSPTLCAIATLISFSLKPDVLIYIPFYIQIPSLYLIALVANLNHREVFRRQIQRPLTLDLSAFDMIPPTEGSQSMQQTLYPTPSFVHSTQTSGTVTIPSTPHMAADDKSSSHTQRFFADDASSCLERGPERALHTLGVV